MIDHVTIRVPELDRARSFYDLALTLAGFEGEERYDSSLGAEWWDFSITEATAERPVTERLHIGFFAPSRAVVDAWWAGMTEAGYDSDGEPGPRPEYGPAYYGAFVLDPAGNSVEAVNDGERRQPGVIDHLWLRTRDLEAITRFYETVCPSVGHRVQRLEGRTGIRGDGATFSYVEGEPTVGVHLAFEAPDAATVDAFHRAGVEAGYRSYGEPGERPEYHPGYYGAFLLDPDGHNIEAVFHDRD
jgi:catechol 2,3-dioxygenase-like lactoylglutathione lyase family enzyme